MATSQVYAETSVSTRLRLSVWALQMWRKVLRQNDSVLREREEDGKISSRRCGGVSWGAAEQEMVTVML